MSEAWTVIRSILDIGATFSWAIGGVEGALISGGVSALELIVGAFLPKDGPTVLETIESVGHQIVKDVQTNEKLSKYDDQLNAVLDFNDWFNSASVLLDTQDVAALVQETTRPDGFLNELQRQTTTKGDSTLFRLVHDLLRDEDLVLGTDDDTNNKNDDNNNNDDHQYAYEDIVHYKLAVMKLKLLMYTATLYLFAIKVEMNLQRVLADHGYDINGNNKVVNGSSSVVQSPHTGPIFNRLRNDTKTFQEGIQKAIDNVIYRRMLAVQTRDVDTSVAYSHQYWNRNEESRIRQEYIQGEPHKGLFLQYDLGSYSLDRVYLVMDKQASPDWETYGRGVHPWTYDEREIDWHDWKRTDVYDGALEKSKNQDEDNQLLEYYVWDWMRGYAWEGGYHYIDKHDMATKKRDEHRQSIQQSLRNDWYSFPKTLMEGIDELGRKIKPTIPEKFGKILLNFPPAASVVDEDEKKEESTSTTTSASSGLWGHKKLYVKYLLKLSTGMESESFSNDETSSSWTKIHQGQSCPSLTGYGVETDNRNKTEKIDPLQYVTHIYFYRQFRIGTTVSDPRPVLKIGRTAQGNGFPKVTPQDFTTTKYEEEFFHQKGLL